MEASSYSVHNIAFPGRQPYIDFISITQKVKEFDTTHLIVDKRPNKYKLIGHKPLYVYKSDYNKTLTLSGSIAWHYQGHNLLFEKKDLRNAIIDISNKLDIDLFDSGVNSFELGKIISVNKPVLHYQNSFHDLKGFNRVHDRNTLYYNKYTRRGKRETVLKIYDAIKNSIAKKMIFQPDGNYMKCEIKMHNPSKHFGYALSLNELVNNEEVLEKSFQYMKYLFDKIEKRKIPSLKSKPGYDDLMAAALLNTKDDPMKVIDDLIKSSGLDTKEASKRRCTIRKKLENISMKNDELELSF